MSSTTNDNAQGQGQELAAPAPSKLSFKPLKECQTLEEAFATSEFRERIEASVPDHVKPSRMLRTFVDAAMRTPLLAKASVRSFIGACLTCSQIGLEPNTPLGNAWLIPFTTKVYNAQTKKRDKEVVNINLIFGYPGLLDLSFRSRLVRAVHADVVWPGDDFSYEYGSDAHLRHRPKGVHPDEAKPVYAYMHATLADGQAYEVMPWADVMRIRDRSQAYRHAVFLKEQAEEKGWRLPAGYTEAPWVKFEVPMARKTAFRAGSKWLPRSIELATAISLDEAQERRRNMDFGPLLQAPTIDGRPDYLGEAAHLAVSEDEQNEADRTPGRDPDAAYSYRQTATIEGEKPAETRREPHPGAGGVTTTSSATRVTWPSGGADAARFEEFLLDQNGEAVEEHPFTDPLVFARRVVALAGSMHGEDREAFLEYNAGAIEEAQEQSPVAAALLREAEEALETKPSLQPPPEVVAVPVERGKPSWTGYVKAFRAAMPDHHTGGPNELLAWLALQRETLATVPMAQRMTAIKAANEGLVAIGALPPEWFTDLLKAPPPKQDATDKPDADERWVAAREADLQAILELDGGDAANQYEVLVGSAAVQTLMARLKREKPALYQRLDAAFEATEKAVQKRAAAEQATNEESGK